MFRKDNIFAVDDYADINNTLETSLAELESVIILFDMKANTPNLKDKLFSIANPVGGNYQGLLKFVSIFETFINKIQEISGVNTNRQSISGFIADSEDHTEPVVSFQKSYGELRNTIKINETFPDIASLTHRNAGYEFVLTLVAKIANNTAAMPTITQIPAQTYLDMADLQFEKYFRKDDSNNSLVGNYKNPNKLRFFTPTQVFIPDRGYPITTGGFSFGGVAPLPYQVNFDYYKPIILDIIEYYLNKTIEKTFSTEAKSNIRRLINIASRYGIIFDNGLFDQLTFLSDPSPEKSEGEYSDSSQFPNLQQQSSQGADTSGIVFDSDEDAASDYTDTDLVTEVNPNIEGLLFGMLSQIILENEKQISPEFKNLVADLGTATTDEVGSRNLPLPIQALFVEYNKSGSFSLLRKYLVDPGTKSFDFIKNIPLNLSTYGWWWFNYINIMEVRYIKEYDRMFNPVWAPLTADAFNNDVVSSGSRIICKLFRYENKDLGIINKNKFLDLPILNEYFIINPIDFSSSVEFELPNFDATIINSTELVGKTVGQAAIAVMNLDASIQQSVTTKKFKLGEVEKLLMNEGLTNLELDVSAQLAAPTADSSTGTSVVGSGNTDIGIIPPN